MLLFETDKIEFKETVSLSLAKEIVAFLNGDGGTIFIGIRKDGATIGVPESSLDEAQRNVSDIITDQISPRCVECVRIHREVIDGKSIIQIDIQESPKLHCIKKYGYSEAGCFVRIGSTCKSLKPEEIEKRFIASLGINEQSIVEIKTKRTDLSFRILKNYLDSRGYHFGEDTFAENLHLLTENGQYNYLAEILSDENDVVINVATFATEDKTIYLKRDEFGGKCLLLAMEQAKNYVEAINQTFVKVGQGARREKKMFDVEAFEQAWFNACVHNRWTESDNPGIYLYSNRLEIESYGGIPKVLTREEFLRGKSRPVNPELFSIFKMCGFGEESGHGVPSVVRAYGEGAFQFSEHFVDVVIPFDIEELGIHQKTNNKTNKKRPLNNIDVNEESEGPFAQKTNNKIHQKTNNKTADAILGLLCSNPRLTREDVSLVLHIKPNTVQYYLSKLVGMGLIKRIGSKKVGYWEIANGVK